jgi:hypothetical protein
VTLQSIIHIAHIDGERFTAQAVTFLESLAAMLEQFGTIAGRAASAMPETMNDADILAMQNMIRI